MILMKRLSLSEINAALGELDGWSVKACKLHKEYKFASFNEAFEFMVRASKEIEKMNHHPEWTNVYNSLTVDLITHDADGITANDVALAKTLDSLW